MSDLITRALSRWGDFDEETVWEEYKHQFILHPPQQRIEELRAADIAMDETCTRPTKEAASILNKVRELTYLHQTLRKVGR